MQIRFSQSLKVAGMARTGAGGQISIFIEDEAILEDQDSKGCGDEDRVPGIKLRESILWNQ